MIPEPVQPGQSAQPQPITIDAVVQLLRDDRMRGFRIDVETDSLVEADQAAEKQAANELVSGLAVFFKEMGPVVQQMPPLAPAVSDLLCFALRRYRVPAELEESIEKAMAQVVQRLENPPPPQPDPAEQAKIKQAEIKAQAEGQKSQMEMQIKQLEAQAKQQQLAMESQAKQQEMAMEAQAQKLDMMIKLLEHQMSGEALERKAAADEHGHKLKLEQMDQQAKMAKQKPKGEK